MICHIFFVFIRTKNTKSRYRHQKYYNIVYKYIINIIKTTKFTFNKSRDNRLPIGSVCIVLWPILYIIYTSSKPSILLWIYFVWKSQIIYYNYYQIFIFSIYIIIMHVLHLLLSYICKNLLLISNEIIYYQNIDGWCINNISFVFCIKWIDI